ncbi:MAG TPA: CopG family transcriptional regulator [Caulobacteraceae bacterium]
MRISVDIPNDQFAVLTRLAERDGVSRAALIRQAIADLLASEKRDALRDALTAAFGIRPDMEDGVAYQVRLRSEW